MSRVFKHRKHSPDPSGGASRRSAGDGRRAARIVRKLESWFASNRRDLPWRRGYDPYHVWLSEIMLQQTRMDVVIPFFERFVKRFPTVHALAGSDEQDVLTAWSGLGYYRRAKMLLAGARHVVGLHEGRIPDRRLEVEKIPGVGRYTSGAILSIAFNQREPIVDGNVVRVLARIDAIELPVGSSQLASVEWQLAGDLVARSVSPRNFNQSLMELGATVCPPRKPACPSCPVSSECRAFQMKAVEMFPLPGSVKPSVAMEIPLFLLTDRGRVLLRKEHGSLMGNMFHLPHGNDLLLPSTRGIRPGPLLGTFRHTITHRRIEFQLFEGIAGKRIADGPDEFVWIDPEQLRRLPHPSYVAKAMRLWERHRNQAG